MRINPIKREAGVMYFFVETHGRASLLGGDDEKRGLIAMSERTFLFY